MLSPFQLEVAELPPSNNGAADLTPSQPKADELRQSEAGTADVPQSSVSKIRVRPSAGVHHTSQPGGANSFHLSLEQMRSLHHTLDLPSSLNPCMLWSL